MRGKRTASRCSCVRADQPDIDAKEKEKEKGEGKEREREEGRRKEGRRSGRRREMGSKEGGSGGGSGGHLSLCAFESGLALLLPIPPPQRAFQRLRRRHRGRASYAFAQREAFEHEDTDVLRSVTQVTLRIQRPTASALARVRRPPTGQYPSRPAIGRTRPHRTPQC